MSNSNLYTIFLYLGLPIFAYLLGSIPWGLVLTRLFSSVDIRRQGSGNIGATNVSRVAGSKLGTLTFAGDILKGAIPVFFCRQSEFCRCGRNRSVAVCRGPGGLPGTSLSCVYRVQGRRKRRGYGSRMFYCTVALCLSDCPGRIYCADRRYALCIRRLNGGRNHPTPGRVVLDLFHPTDRHSCNNWHIDYLAARAKHQAAHPGNRTVFKS